MRLRDLLAALHDRGALCVIERDVPMEAIPELIQDEERAQNRSISFQRVSGYRAPVVANVYGSLDRYALSIGEDLATVWDRVDAAIANPVRTVRAEETPCFEVVHDDPDVAGIVPAIQYSTLDGGPYITSAVVLMRDPDTGRNNLSFIRLQIKGRNRRGFNAVSVHARACYQKHVSRGRPMEVAIALGPPSELFVAAAHLMPYEVDELEVATALAPPDRRDAVAVVGCKTVDLDVPAASEIVIEGVVSSDLEEEGPFGDWTGMYRPSRMNPTVRINQLSHRKDALYQTLLPGASKEQSVLARARVLLQLAAIRRGYPEIARIALPAYGCGRLVIIAVRGSERVDRIISDCLEIPTIVRAIVTNDDVEVDDPADVLWAITHRVSESQRLTATSFDEYASSNLKLGIDATLDLGDIRHRRPQIMRMSDRHSLPTA